MRKFTFIKIMLLAIVMMVGSGSVWGQIAAWDFFGNNTATATFTATTFNANLVSTSGANNITRGATAAASAANNSFRTTGFKNEGISTANTDYYQITLGSAAGYALSLSTIDAKFGGTATFYASPGVTSQFAYSLDGSTFTLIGSSVQSTSLTMTQINLSGITALQNVASGTTVTIRYYASGQTTTGGWGFLSATSAGTNGLVIGGSVNASGLLTPPTLTADATLNDVDHTIDIPFSDDPTWRGALSAVKVGGTSLTVTTDYILSSGNLQLIPSGGNTLLTTAGSKSITVEATGYNTATVTQQINAGTATKLGMKTQPATPSTNGAVLATQPAVYIQDQYGNTTTSTASVVASVGAGSWTLGGTASVAAVSGTTTFSGLTASSAAAVTGATISFTSEVLTGISSTTFNIPAPVPTINLSTATLTNFSYQQGSGPSTEKTFTVSGLNLTNDISLAASTDYEISLASGAGYTTPLTLTQSGGTVVTTTIYVRLKAGLSTGTYNSELINITSTDATPATVTCSGIVNGTYYSIGSGDPAVFINWTINRDGSGSSPANFTSGDIFVIENADNMTTTTAWAISGTGSKLWIENGGILTANNAITLASATTFQIDNGGTYIHNNTGIPSSTIYNGTENFGSTSSIRIDNWVSNTTAITTGVTLPFGNLEINWTSNTLNWQNGLSGTIILCAGNLTITSVGTGTIRFAASTAPTITVSGNLTQTAGTVNLASTSGITVFNVGGNFAVNGGTFTSTSTGSKVVLNGSSTQTFANAGTISVANFEVSNAAGAALTSNATLSNLTLNASAVLNVNAGKQLTLSTTLTNNGTLNLLSDATGTATILTPTTISGSGTVNVKQYLTGHIGTSTRANWYLSSPVSAATAAVFNVEGGTNKMTSYDETVPGYLAQFTSNATALVPGKGYATYIGGADATYTFTGGSLNNGDLPAVTVTRTGTSAGKRGFNLVGNPYPSYLDWNAVKAAATSSSNVRPTIWYRTRTSGGAMTFDTFDGTTGTDNGANGMVTQYVPPMQAFWMKVDADDTSATLNFVNGQRSHKDQSLTTNRLRAPGVDELQILRLKVSNGINSDAAIVVSDANALDVFDYYDSQKMTNDNVNVPEIYTLAGTEELVINHLNNFSANKELALGFRPGMTSNFTIEASQISNLNSDLKVMLLDKLTNTEQELSLGSPYSFTSDATASNDRFSILFKSTSVTTGPGNTADNSDLLVYRNLNNQITVISNGTIDDQSSVSVYNAVGKKLTHQKMTKTTTEINGAFTPGVYMVTVNNGGLNMTKKIIIK